MTRRDARAPPPTAQRAQLLRTQPPRHAFIGPHHATRQLPAIDQMIGTGRFIAGKWLVTWRVAPNAHHGGWGRFALG